MIEISIKNYMQGAIDTKNPIDGDADYYQGKIDACRDILELLKEQPQELDEAAEKCAIKYSGWTTLSKKECFINIFKAGAKWQAEQGASYDTEVGWIDGPTVLDWPDDILDSFEMGDKVIVQIRKNED